MGALMAGDFRHLVAVDPPRPGPLDVVAIAREIQAIAAETQALVTAQLPTAFRLVADAAAAEAESSC